MHRYIPSKYEGEVSTDNADRVNDFPALRFYGFTASRLGCVDMMIFIERNDWIPFVIGLTMA